MNTIRTLTLSLGLATSLIAAATPADDARRLLDAGQPAEAAALLAEQITGDTAPARVHHVYGLALLAQVTDPEMPPIDRMQMGQQGGDHLIAAVNAAPDNLDYRESLLEYYLQAPRMAGGSADKAQEQAAEMLSRDQRRGTLAHARIARYQDDYALSARLLAAALEDIPTDYDLNIDHVLSHIGTGDFDSARAAITQWRDNVPDDPRSDYQLGRLAAVSGQFLDDGQTALKRYLANDTLPADAAEPYWARLRLAMVLLHQQQTERAVEQLNLAEQGAPASDAYFAETAQTVRQALP